MKIRILSFLGIIIALYACSKSKTSISALCEKDHKGNFTLKWEVFPEEDDVNIEIYASDNDTVFPSSPIKRVNVNNFIAVIEDADSLNYSYFKLKIRDTYSDVISNRLFELDEVQNFRDLGGYKTNDGRSIRWGKVFRSGEFHNLTKNDVSKLDELHLKTVVDLRSTHSQKMRPDSLPIVNRYQLPIIGTTNDSIAQKVIEGRFLRGDAILYMQDMYEQMLGAYGNQFAKLFDLMADEKNYPLVFHCSLGKDQSGVAAYFLLKALDVPSEVGEDDYMISNIGVDKSKIIKGAFDMSESQQEAFTMLTRTDVAYLRYGLGCSKKLEGSVDDYMINRLGLTKEKREKLREILLY